MDNQDYEQRIIELSATVLRLEKELANCYFPQDAAKILERITDAFYGLDYHWRFTYINKEAAKFVKMKHQDLLGKNIFELFPTLIGSEVEKNYKKAMLEQVVIHFETPSNVFPGIWFEMHVYPSTDGLSVYFRDISEYKRIQKQLFETQKLEAVGQLAGGLAHELNNQLTLIMGYADLRLFNLPYESPFYQDLVRIKNVVKKSAELTRQLLMFSRRQPLYWETINLNHCINEFRIMLEKLVGEDVILNLKLSPDLRMIKADTTNVEQIITNLIINARDSIPGKGRITLITENRIIKETDRIQNDIPAGNYVVFTIQDNGVGIEEQIIPHIFEPFFTTKDRSKGTGLGLSVVYGIVKAHEGWVNVQSQVGKGTRFEILFPAVLAMEEQTMETSNKICLPYKQYHGNGERIMIIEDQVEILTILEASLIKHGFRVFLCQTISDAIRTFKDQKGQFDLILSDIILPDGRGTDLVMQLLLEIPTLKVILVSGYSDEHIQLEKIRRLGFPFLSKPYTIEDVLKQIYETLNSIVNEKK